jgi:16S rRNA (cytosine1402-N4)-methyltransferase
MGVAHKSVLYKEALEALAVKPGETYIDATIDGGGHAKGILELRGRVLGIDIDPQSIRQLANRESLVVRQRDDKLYAISDRLTLVQGNFADLGVIAKEFGVLEAAGILFDLGLSSDQLEEAERGFSFSKSGPLDMRLDPKLAVTAADLVNGLNEGELYELFTKLGEEPNSRRLARAIVRARIDKRIETTTELARLAERVVGRAGRIHPATRVFLALRIAVNDELNNLKKGLEEAASLLKKDGRLVVISFHSLEDRMVKNFFKKASQLKVLTEKPVGPSVEEILANPRARSGKMRAAERI